MAQIKKYQNPAGPITQSTPNSITYKGVNFDKNALMEGYKNYLKTTAQNNVTGFQQADQYKDIDEHLNTRLTNLQGVDKIEENKSFTTAPTEVNGITGFNKFLDSGDKSKSQQFENEAFYNYLDKSVELNKASSPTTTTKDYHRFHSITGRIAADDFANKIEGFNSRWDDSTYNIDDKKKRIKTALISELTNLKNSGTKEIIGIDKDTAAKLKSGDADKYISEIPTADDNRLAEIAGHLGLNTELEKLLYVPKTEQAPVVPPVAATAPVAPVTTQPLNKGLKPGTIIRTTTKYFHPKQKVTAPTLGSKWGTSDWLEAGTTAADLGSLAGGAVGVGSGLVGTGLQLAADLNKGSSGTEIAKNLGINLGFAALALIPGLGGESKFAFKTAKSAEAALEAAKAAKGFDKILDSAKAAEEVIKTSKDLRKIAEAKKVIESANAIKASETVAREVIEKGLKNNKWAGRIAGNKVLRGAKSAVNTGLIVNGLNTGYEAVKQTASDIQQGGLENISLNDVRGLTAGLAGTKGLYHGLVNYAGTTNKQVVEAATKVSLKNVPKGLESELKTVTIPKGTKDMKSYIDEHINSKIQEKQAEIKNLSESATPESGPEIKTKGEQLDKELKLLQEAKEKVSIDQGKLGSKWAARKLGAGKVKEVNEKVIKETPDESGLIPKRFQQHAIDKLSGKSNAIKTKYEDALSEMDKGIKSHAKVSRKLNRDNAPLEDRLNKIIDAKRLRETAVINQPSQLALPQGRQPLLALPQGARPMGKYTGSNKSGSIPMEELTQSNIKSSQEYKNKKIDSKLADDIKKFKKNKVKSNNAKMNYKYKNIKNDPFEQEMLNFKDGGILKYADGGPNKRNIVDIISKMKRANQLGYTMKINDTLYGNPKNPNFVWNSKTNRQEPASQLLDTNRFTIAGQPKIASTSSTIQTLVKPTIEPVSKVSPTKQVVKPTMRVLTKPVVPIATIATPSAVAKPVVYGKPAPWLSDEYKNDPFLSKQENWNDESKSGAVMFTPKPNKGGTKVTPTPPVIPTTVTPTIPTANNLVSTFIKPTPTAPQSKLSLPNLAEPFKYITGLNVNAQNLKTSIEHLDPVLKQGFNEQGVNKNWLNIKGAYAKAAIDTQRLASRPISSDASLMKASQLEGANRANELLTQGAEKASEITDLNSQNAVAIANRNAERNVNVANENASTIGAYRAAVGNLIAGKRMQNYANLTKFTDAITQQVTDRNIIKHENDVTKQRQGLFNDYKGTLKPLQAAYEKYYGVSGDEWENSPEGIDYKKQQEGAGTDAYSWTSEKNRALRDQYDKNKAAMSKKFGETKDAAKEAYELGTQNLDVDYDPTAFSFVKPKWFPTFGKKKIIYKAGGSTSSLSAGQKYEIEILKLKQKSQANADKNYQKTLDRTDKHTAKVLDGLSREKLMLLKTILGTK